LTVRKHGEDLKETAGLCSSFRVEDEVVYPYNQRRERAWFGVF